MTKKVIYLDDVLETIEKCEHYPLLYPKKIKEGIVDFLGLGIKYLDIKEAIEQLPSAQPEIIRCKDCKYGGMKEFEEGYCGGGAIDQEITGMDYCSWAERRTDGKTD